MPRSFLIKKHYTSGAVKCKRPRVDDNLHPVTQPKRIANETWNLEITQNPTPPQSPPPEVTTLLSPSSPDVAPSGPFNSNATSPWPKAITPPFLPFNFPSLYPVFPQLATTPDFYRPIYPVSLSQRTDQPPTLKKPEPLASLPVDANISDYIYRAWYKNKEPCVNDSTGISNSDGVGEASQTRRKVNRDAPRYQCPDCNKSYSTLSGLNKHQQFHCLTQAQKSFGCKYCDKVYVSLGALKMHVRTHTLPCKCKLCGKAFSRPWLLQGHVRTHTGEKPFACQHCNRAFADRSNLRAHLQTHSDVKKYSCKGCSKTFSRMSLLVKHEEGCCGGRNATSG